MKMHKITITSALLCLFLAQACSTDSSDTSNDGDLELDGDVILDGDISESDPDEEMPDDIQDGDLDEEQEVDGDREAEMSMPWLKVRRGEHPGIFDSLDRQVLLRGVNFNHLGDYWQGHPSLPTVAELGADDWDDAAALGTSVIRLVTTWSFWTPERDQFDEEYLARVRAAITEANAHDMYVVIDMHQDAWSKFVFTPAEEECPEGTRHQKGWDGAPEWATFTDGEPTCTPGRREDSPAVVRAWDNFYTNRDGIRDELVELWRRIASEFAHHPGVAGFDLINEPGQGTDTTRVGLTTFYGLAIDAIREAEAEADSEGHVIFFEPSAYATLPDFDMSDDPNLVFGAHNYFESITPGEGLLDTSFGLYAWLAEQYGQTTVWIGEYGSFSDPETNEAWMARFAALEDQFPGAGSAWWQWEQRCGDPHSVQHPPTPEWLEEQVTKCDDARFIPVKCVERAYPRAVPGLLLSIGEGACEGNLVVTGSTEAPGTADLWYPSQSDTEPDVTGAGIEDVTALRVTGGWRIQVSVSGEYRIEASGY